MSHISLEFLPQIADLLTTALAHFVWQGMALSLMLFVAVRLIGIRSVQTRYMLSVATLLMMGLAPILTIMWRCQNVDRIHDAGLSGDSTTVLAHSFAIASAEAAKMKHVSALLHRPDVQLAVMAAWLAGVLILSTRLFVGFGITLWVRANVKPVSGQIEELSRKLGERMGVTVGKRVFASMRIGQAVAVGFIRPIVLIPVAWLTELTPEILEAVIAHELAHIRRWDLWVNLVQRVIETLLFFHPAVWWLSSRIRLEREMCCDEIAAGCLDREVYARSLESVARIVRGNLLLATSIQGGIQMNLLSRIRYLLGAAPVDVGNWGGVGFVTMAVSFVVATMFSLSAVSTPSIATADDGKEAVTEITGGVEVHLEADRAVVFGTRTLSLVDFGKKAEAGNGIHIEADEVSVEMQKGRNVVGVRLTGDLGKKYARYLGISIRDGGHAQIETTGYVEQILDDGRYRIEHSTRIASDKKSSRLLTLTAIVDPKKIQTEIIPKNTPIFSSPGEKESTLSESDQKNLFVELSDLKGVKLQTWELKEEISE